MTMAKVLMALFMAITGVGAEKTQHVVGGDRGWDPNSDLASWSSGRHFWVGDEIWFTYSAAQENILELKTKEEYEACDVTSPIRIFTDGLDILTIDKEKIHYFASGKSESCKNGLKLHVDVQNQLEPNNQNTGNSVSTTMALADGPTTPSVSTKLSNLSLGFYVGFLVYLLVL